MDNKELLKIIADNPNLLTVIKKLLIDKFEIPSQKLDVVVEDVVLGQILRARLVGINKIEEAFKEIEEYKTVVEKKEEKVNHAR